MESVCSLCRSPIELAEPSDPAAVLLCADCLTPVPAVVDLRDRVPAERGNASLAVLMIALTLVVGSMVGQWALATLDAARV